MSDTSWSRTLIVTVACITVALESAGAQGSTRALQRPVFTFRVGTPREEVAKLYVRLVFAGISLNPNQLSKATQITSNALADRDALDPQAADVAQNVTRIVCQQDAALRELLVSKADKVRFDANTPTPPEQCGRS